MQTKSNVWKIKKGAKITLEEGINEAYLRFVVEIKKDGDRVAFSKQQLENAKKVFVDSILKPIGQNFDIDGLKNMAVNNLKGSDKTGCLKLEIQIASSDNTSLNITRGLSIRWLGKVMKTIAIEDLPNVAGKTQEQLFAEFKSGMEKIANNSVSALAPIAN